MERSHRRVAAFGPKPLGWRALRDLLDPDGAAWALIKEREQRYAARRTGNDSGPPPTQKG